MPKANTKNQMGDGQSVQITEEYLTENNEFRHNRLSNKVEFRERMLNAELLLDTKEDGGQPMYAAVEQAWKPMTDEALNSLVRKAKIDLPKVKNLKTNIVEFLYSDDIPSYDPAADWLNNLPAWDGQDRLTEFFGRIPGIRPVQIQRFIVWMRSAVAHFKQMDTLHGNENIAMLIGDQGCGKTIFWRRLLPPHLQCYFLDRLNFGNKFDTDMALSNNLIVNIDEIDQLTPQQQPKLKYQLSKNQVNGCAIFEKNQRTRPRYASFVASTNNPHPLSDPTGSRRFLCVRIPEGMEIDNTLEINYEQLYAQVLHEICVEQKRYWFTTAECREIEHDNLEFQETKDLSEMLMVCFRKPEAHEHIKPISSDQIISGIQHEYPTLENNQSIKSQIGRILVEMGVERRHGSKGSLYMLISRKAA